VTTIARVPLSSTPERGAGEVLGVDDGAASVEDVELGAMLPCSPLKDSVGRTVSNRPSSSQTASLKGYGTAATACIVAAS
jgi:hypothetical protein